MANGNEITTDKARPSLGHSAQSKWQKKQQAAGNCRSCGKPRPPELKQHCADCQAKVNAYMKKYRALKRASTVKELIDAVKPAKEEPNVES